ncbi:unnamed protein product [Lupinus luteus]|uniref:Uncharacterized protein n=1 Tax=Lupinus luteus TaxID=3873 RepID=A0AAV1X013_LUPLU
MDVVQESKEEKLYQMARRKEYFKHFKEDYFKPSSSIPSPFQAVFVPFPGENIDDQCE